ncbi:hypothetical protein [Glutamicibacter sp. V16R2B1]|uniref:hypothetical protein n=1 Tax=Glutamicibacter sp. V16R2B1 TaxID=2036207 RepID=UPI0010FEC65F|nr:hypothetical protein [Glutamicibacter sp. V16R2B1]TLK56324.1 hypothetical protein FDN03_02420 [Glutamicibacter sp. V16R2B1]
MTSDIVDDSDSLSALTSIPAAAELMPASYDPSTPSITWEHVGTALEPWHVAYRAMRAAGYGVAVPKVTSGTRLVETEIQGSLIASVGRLQVASADKSIGWSKGYTYLEAGTIRYIPAVSLAPGGLRLWLRWHGNNSAMSAQFSDGTTIAVRGAHTGSTITLTYTVRSGGYDGPIQFETTRSFSAAWGSEPWIEVFVRPGDTTARVVVPTSGTGATTPNSEIAHSIPVNRTYQADAVLEDVRVTTGTIAAQAGSISLAGWQASVATVFDSTVKAWGKGLVESMGATNTILDTKAGDILREVGQATLTAIFFDEHGVLNFAPTNVLHAGSPVRTVTTAQDIFELGWMEALLTRRKQVGVEYRETALTLSKRYEVLLYQPSNSQQVGAGETIEEFIGPDDDAEWFEPDMTFSAITLSDIVNFNLGRDSWYGGVYRSGDGDTYVRDTSLAIGTQEIEVGRRWLMRHRNPSTRDVSMMAPPESTAVYAKWLSAPLPILRGRGLANFTNANVTASTGAPSWTPALEHELGVYGKKADATRVRDWLAARLKTGIITLTDVQIAYDPRLQLGDVITVESKKFYGFSMDALIIGKSESHDDAGAQMSLSVRTLTVRTTHTTYQDFEDAYQGRNYAALEQAWSSATYAALENNPTGRA